jgi:hypothetical protein
MYDLNSATTKMNSNPPPAPRAFASLLSGGILVIGAITLSAMYRGPASLSVVCIAAILIFAVACLVYSSVQIADQWDKAVVLSWENFKRLAEDLMTFGRGFACA